MTAAAVDLEAVSRSLGREIEVRARPGMHHVKLRVGDEKLISQEFDVPPSGLSGLVLTMRREEDEADIQF